MSARQGCFPTTESNPTDDMRGTRCYPNGCTNHGTLNPLPGLCAFQAA